MKKHTASAIAALFLLASLAWPVLAIDIGAMPNPSFYDSTNGVAKVEGQFSYKIVTADTQVKASAGFVHAISCATTAGAAATAGALTLRDATTETTPIVHTIGIPASAFTPFGFVIDEVFATGIYAGFDGTLAGVSCTVSYR